MGTKERSFSPLPLDVSLEGLVPQEHFCRRLEERIDLSFVRDLVASLYAGGGRPLVDPVVFFKLQFVVFFKDLRFGVPAHEGGCRTGSRLGGTWATISTSRCPTTPASRRSSANATVWRTPGASSTGS